jgi:glycerophosphoryl diester phosphodiesterase
MSLGLEIREQDLALASRRDRVDAAGMGVVMHDTTVDSKTDGRGTVASKTLRQLKRLDAAYWFGLMAPAGTPPAVITRLEKALADAVVHREVRNRLGELGTLVTPMNAKEFGAFIQSEMAKWRDAVKNANVKIE